MLPLALFAMRERQSLTTGRCDNVNGRVAAAHTTRVGCYDDCFAIDERVARYIRYADMPYARGIERSTARY